MAAPLPNAIPELIQDFPMGMNSGVAPERLSPQQVAMSVNVTFREGKARSRPPIRKVPLTYENETTQTRATQALFQGAAGYLAFKFQQDSLIAQIGGRQFRYRVGFDNGVEEISLAGDLNNATVPVVDLFQAEDFLLITDGLANPLYWDSAAMKRSAGPPTQLPPGVIGSYINGRVILVRPDRRSYIAGDLVYSKGALGAYGGRDAVLGITENQSILGGAAFAVPMNAGPLTAVAAAAIPDTSLGQGNVKVCTRRGIFGVDLPLDANTWTTLQLPTQTVSLPAFGPVSNRCVVHVNGDLWYRSSDGIRSYAVARRDFNTWVQTPMSVEVERVLKADSKQLLPWCSAAHFDNRLLVTCSPLQVVGRGVVHRGLIALDFNNISNLTTRSNPVYDGLWTGLPILQILTASINDIDRCFIFALDANEDIALYELMYDNGVEVFDFDGTNDVLIESSIETGAIMGSDLEAALLKMPLKRLQTADLFLKRIKGTVQYSLQYLSDQYPFWVDWHTWSICATASNCTTAGCPTFQDPQNQYATFVRVPSPQDTTCFSLTGRPLRTGYFFQLRFKWTGLTELHRMIVWADRVTETIPECPGEGSCQLLAGCTTDLFTYSIET